jgi:thymidylate kinase
MIVKLHGNSGSGKTTLARMLMNLGVTQAMGGKPTRPDSYRVLLPDEYGIDQPIFILGPYTATCGGLDSVGSWAEVSQLVETYADQGHILMEGLLSSTYYGGLGQFLDKYRPNIIFAFMDTPLEVCIDRVKTRRANAGNTKPFNEENTRNREKPIQNVRIKVEALGHRVEVIRHDDHPLNQLLEMYR